MTKEAKLFEIADRQQGYFTAQQAKNCGYYDSHFPRYIKSGEWVKEQRGIYHLTQYPLADRPDLIIWSLWSRNKQGEIQGVWSHETALDLYDVCDIMPARLHMTVPKKFRKSEIPPNAPQLYFTDLRKSDWTEERGYRLTTFIQTLLDLIGTQQISLDLIEQAVVEGKKKGLLIKKQITSLPKGDTQDVIERLYEKKYL